MRGDTTGAGDSNHMRHLQRPPEIMSSMTCLLMSSGQQLADTYTARDYARRAPPSSVRRNVNDSEVWLFSRCLDTKADGRRTQAADEVYPAVGE